jgi:carbonic anhydrase
VQALVDGIRHFQQNDFPAKIRLFKRLAKGQQPIALLESMPAVSAWLRHAESARRIVAPKYGHLRPPERAQAAVQENVLVQLDNLRTHPPVAAGLAGGTLKLHAWVYKLETGQVFAYDPERGPFAPLTGISPAGSASGQTDRDALHLMRDPQGTFRKQRI